MTLGRLVDGLMNSGHDVQVVRPRQPHDGTGTSRSGIDEVLAKGIPIPAYGDLRFGLPSKQRLCRLWTERRPDIVHVVTEGPLGWSAVAAARKLKLPVSSSFHTNFQTYTSHYGIGLLKSPIEAYLKKLHNKTMATMVPTKAMVAQLCERGYENVTLVSRGVETHRFSPSKRSEELRASWGIGPKDCVVILVGRLAREKNVGLVVTAFNAIKSRRPDAKLVFVGDGPMRKPLEAACPQAIFAGVRQGDELAVYYASGDLFLFPSLSETFGNVVPEALASGLAVVSYDCAAAQELIVDGHSGRLVPPGDEVEFVRAALSVATTPHEMTRLGLAASISVAGLHWGAVVERFAEVLGNLVEKSVQQAIRPMESYTGVKLTGAQESLAHPNIASLG
jgi:glycosyltransferase involved in cell wall biosynthesis